MSGGTQGKRVVILGGGGIGSARAMDLAREAGRGRVAVRQALTEPERMDFPGVGTLKAFDTDGLAAVGS